MSLISRRGFLHSTTAGSALLGLGNAGFLHQLPAVSASEAKANSKLVKLQPDIEPLVRLLEDTPRDRLLEEMAQRIHKGVSYQEVLAALQLAGVRNVQPRPSVGFKFHAVLVVNSAHLASLASPDAERWLPIFWALDYFKSSQAQTQRESGWRMGPVAEASVPGAGKVRQAFTAAMNNWDVPAADAAVAGLARTAGAMDIYEQFFRFGARDFRSIGHKAIFVASSWRALQAIGWEHAEPILRSLAYALLNHEGSNPARRDGEPDLPGRRNAELVKKVRKDWQGGKLSDLATRELLVTFHKGSEEDASRQVVELLNKGVAPQSIWDGLLTGAAELLIRKPGIVALHALTTTNALRHAYQTTGDDETRRYILLQNAAFLPMFREAMKRRGKVREIHIDQLQPIDLEEKGKGGVAEIFADVSRDRMKAAQKTLTWLKQNTRPQQLIDAARLLIFFKGNNSHDYKFSSAVLEDYVHLSPGWRDRYLAGCMFQLRGSGGRDNSLVERTREALKG